MSASDDIRTYFEGRYIGSWDLMGQDVTVTIESITPGVVEGEKGRRDKAPLVRFKGWPLAFVLNKTNMASIKALHGTLSASALVGKRLTLYATTCQGKGGGTVDCIRIRPKLPDCPGVPQSAVKAVSGG